MTEHVLFLVAGMGMTQPVGHVDFYPNSGVHMPGCKLSFEEYLEMENGSVVNGTPYMNLRLFTFFVTLLYETALRRKFVLFLARERARSFRCMKFLRFIC